MTDKERELWELYQKAANDPNCAGVVHVKKRGRQEEYNFRSLLMAQELNSGGVVGIIAKSEDQKVLDNWLWWLTNIHGVEVDVRIMTRNDGLNVKLKFDEYGEVLGVDFIPQEKHFIGWQLTKKQKS